MGLTDARLKSLLAYCHIDTPDESDLLTLRMGYGSAVEYMRGAGVAEPKDGTPRRDAYDTCVNYMVLDTFDRRDGTVTGTVSENPSFRRLLNQLKLTEPRTAAR